MFPRLTTVEQPFFDIAKAGTGLLIDLIEERQKGPRQIVLPSRFVIRDSV